MGVFDCFINVLIVFFKIMGRSDNQKKDFTLILNILKIKIILNYTNLYIL